MCAADLKVLRALLVGRKAHGAKAIETLLARAPRLVPPYERVDVTRVETLSAALSQLSQELPHLVLAELSLPDAQGVDVFEGLRAAAPELPLVLVTEFEDDEVGFQAVQLGAADCLVEGELSLTLLAQSIQHALARLDYDEAAKDSHRRFRLALEESETAWVVANSGGRVLYSNPAAIESLGERPLRLAKEASPGRLQFEFATSRPAYAESRESTTLWEGQVASLLNLQVTPGAEAADPDQAAKSPPQASLFEGMLSASPRMRAAFAICEKVAPTKAAVLLQGETGTGKELFARAIHKRSGRAGRFVGVDCGAIPESLIDSELFGHERGAFSGATARKIGLFRHAHGGTLLLDEISNMPLSSQHSLLRVLQEGVVRPVGGTDEIVVDVRLIAASSASLHEAAREQKFREDLLYRLDVIHLEIPPLRDRPEDIIHLLRVFSEQLTARYDVAPLQPGPGFLRAAVDYPWRGNVRQLENFAERLLLTGSPCYSRRDFQALVEPGRPAQAHAACGPCADKHTDLSLAEFLQLQEQAYLEALLRKNRGSLQAAAEQADVDRRTISRKLKRHQIDRNKFLP